DLLAARLAPVGEGYQDGHGEEADHEDGGAGDDAEVAHDGAEDGDQWEGADAREDRPGEFTLPFAFEADQEPEEGRYEEGPDDVGRAHVECEAAHRGILARAR